MDLRELRRVADGYTVIANLKDKMVLLDIEGEWLYEPDVVRWTDKHTGLACMVSRGPYLNMNGYVGITKNNKFFGKDETYINNCIKTYFCITHAGGMSKQCENGEGLCWFGFDCCYSPDFVPALNIGYITAEGDPAVDCWNEQSYKNVSFVYGYIVSLEKQLKDKGTENENV